ncbi:hypothetical protein [Acinetobacter sp.]|jgi:hypothetical protein|uniref:hypothetical protein n=1 Tax=Acinetobacter sp. TaxID=472 RepID=UPI0035B27A2A
MTLLEEIFKNKKAGNSAGFNLRIQRGLSWLKKANDLNDDPDLQYLSFWVAFHALYAQDAAQQDYTVADFLNLLCLKDAENKFGQMIWQKYSQPIQQLLNQQTLHQEFWDYQNQKISMECCKDRLAQDRQQLQEAFEHRQTAAVLTLLFERLQTLNLQLMHGGMVYGSTVNGKYVQLGCRIMGALMPVMILLLMENAQEMDFGKPFYPAAQVC